MSPMLRQVNKDFFKKWTPEMAYVLGFFAADGAMYKTNRGTHYITFQINDKELLIEIRNVMQSTHKITRRIKKNKNWEDSFRLQIGSKEMYNDLLNLCMTQAKTSTLNMPNVPSKYLGDFVRGYFDGDGNVWVGEVHKERLTSLLSIQTVFTCGSNQFLLELRERLKSCGLSAGSFINSGNAFRLQYSIKDSIILAHLMYSNCCNNLFLDRKRVKFYNYLKRRQK